MNTVIQQILTSNEVETPSGKKIRLHSHITEAEGALLLDLFKKDSSICKTLEVGCAYGLSSLFIAEGLKDRANPHHTIVDPYQSSQWEGIGINNLKKSGFERFELIEEKSEIALPSILKKNEGGFDLVLIDGWHTFDHTLVDCFYATRLLRTGGYLAVDDTNFPAIRRVIDYLLLYPCFKLESFTSGKATLSARRKFLNLLLSPIPDYAKKKIISGSLLNKLRSEEQSMVVLKKISNDDRDWYWFIGDF